MLPTLWRRPSAFGNDRFFKMFDEMLARWDHGIERDPYRSMQVTETEDAWIVETACPGYGPENIQVWVEGDWLRVEGELVAGSGDDRTVHGRFSRTVTLPMQFADVDAIEASVVNGMARVLVPRAEAHKPRRISVEVKDGRKLGQKLAEKAKRLFHKKDDASATTPPPAG